LSNCFFKLGTIDYFSFFFSSLIQTTFRIRFVRNWKYNSFFFKANILPFFDSINKRKLKNLFVLIFKDLDFWEEIDKMFQAGIISISSDFVYEKKDFFSNSFLSIFLLELYLFDLDLFVFNLYFQFNSLCVLFL
jgi:hypothetical protein